MEEEPSILEALLDDGEEDIEMVDVEEGQLFEQTTDATAQTSGEANNNGGGGGESLDTAMNPGKKKRKKNRKNKKKKQQPSSGPAPPVEINRFVIDTCRRLKEKKSYLIYSAVGTLGVEALSDLVREVCFLHQDVHLLIPLSSFMVLILVDAIQSCGGQMTADGKRSRTGGGILWNILKAREPAAYREIMKQAKAFEKQLFKQQKMMMRSANAETVVGLCNETANAITEDATPTKFGELVPESQQLVKDNGEMKRGSVHDRIRVPVSYEDLIQDEPEDSCS
ncbi:unnamed protein product [Linum tenue]|uniref:Phosphorylated adapter RNA export protein n=1 Tax=Linum tenue TaxID=586396 RepID=A0AAV0Q1E2_9ROSI|nr:unnamed protein product [Linum tenue]